MNQLVSHIWYSIYGIDSFPFDGRGNSRYFSRKPGPFRCLLGIKCHYPERNLPTELTLKQLNLRRCRSENKCIKLLSVDSRLFSIRLVRTDGFAVKIGESNELKWHPR